MAALGGVFGGLAGFVEPVAQPAQLEIFLLVSGTTITVSWVPVVGAVGYNVYCGRSADSLLPVADGLLGTSFSITSLTGGAQYFVQVEALFSARAAIASQVVTAMACSGDIRLSWGAVAGAASYSVYQSNSPGGEGTTPVQIGVTGTSAQVDGLVNGTACYFVVAALGPNIQVDSSEVGVTPVALTAPVVTAAPGVGQVGLSWSGSGGESYSVYAGAAPGAETLYQAGVTGNSATITGLNNGQTYYFNVVNVNACGQTAPSAEIAATTVMPSPVGVAALACSGDVELSWDAVANAAGYNVYMGTASGGESPTPVLADVEGTVATVPDLANGTEYFFEIKAIGVNALSAASSEVSAVPAAVLPPSVTATPGDGVVTLSFASQVNVSYAAFVSMTSGGEGPPAAGTVAGTGGSVSIEVGGLRDGLEYYFTVMGTNLCGQSTTSAEVNAIPVPSAQLSGLVWQLPCLDAGCHCAASATDSVTMEAAPGASFSVTLRIRGVVELKNYTGGTNDGAYFQTGGAPASGPQNYYELSISSPPQTYYINRNNGSGIDTCFVIDYEATVTINAGATVSLYANSGGDDLQAPNSSNLEVSNNDPAHPVVVGQPYNGQFAQVDAVSVTLI